MSNIQTIKYNTNPQQFDMNGQRLSVTLSEKEGCISTGMIKRLMNYANKEILEAGFEAFIINADVSIYNFDDESQYTIRWQNKKGGYIELIAINTVKGWPTLNFGFSIGVED